MITRRHFLGCQLAGLAVSLPVLGLIAGPAAAAPEVFAEMGLALGGADPVSYFRVGAPVSGRPEFGLMWRGAVWQFASAAHRDLFEMDPGRYCPRYGGYCAYAMAHGALSASVPEAWTIHEDRLYLTHSLRVRDLWRADVPGHVAMADPHWPSILAG
jgi:hypothetical protein